MTFHDEDALLVSKLLGRDFADDALTLPKEEADRALQKLLAIGHKAAFYGDENKPKFDEHGNRIKQSAEPQPVGKGLFSYFNGTIKELISEAKKKWNALVKKIISPVSSRLQEDLSPQGLEVDGYNHVLDNSAIRHTLKQHGGEDEVKRGQIPITEEDFDRLPDVVKTTMMSGWKMANVIT